MRPVFEKVLLICPEAATGGPEAMHQLAYKINQDGGDARLAYTGQHSRLVTGDDFIRCEGDTSQMQQYYAEYQPRVLQEMKCGPDTLFVYPERAFDLAVAPSIAGARHAIWWLSVDNAVLKEPRLADVSYRRNLLANPQLIHFHQSAYAREFLKGAGVTSHPLSDYIDLQFIKRSQDASANPPITQRANKICFFPRKGTELAKEFIANGMLHHPVDFVPIHNMTKAQVQDTLFSAKIYIDFGHHPGKDRVPREAAMAGAIVLVHTAGAANYYDDYPLADEYRFSTEDVASGKLHSRIDVILDEPEKHFNAQQNYRDIIAQEQGRFDAEIRSFFFTDA